MLGSLPTAFMQRNDSSNSGLSVHHQHQHHHRRTPPPQVHTAAPAVFVLLFP
jgi:hypothetical protein